MTVQTAIPTTEPHALPPRANGAIHNDSISRIDHRRRTRELRELAAAERIPLPMPPEWIATLEMFGYVVDLVTGAWAEPAEYWPGPALCDPVSGATSAATAAADNEEAVR